MLARELLEMCAEMGQIPVAQQVFDVEWHYSEDPVCKRLVFCCNLVFVQLYSTFSNAPCPFRIEDIFDSCELPAVKKADGTAMTIPREVFCYGVLAEYFLQVQDYACFKLWNQRYETELANIRLCKDYKPLPVGRWI